MHKLHYRLLISDINNYSINRISLNFIKILPLRVPQKAVNLLIYSLLCFSLGAKGLPNPKHYKL